MGAFTRLDGKPVDDEVRPSKGEKSEPRDVELDRFGDVSSISDWT